MASPRDTPRTRPGRHEVTSTKPHEEAWAKATALAEGDTKRIEIKSPWELKVHNRRIR